MSGSGELWFWRVIVIILVAGLAFGVPVILNRADDIETEVHDRCIASRESRDAIHALARLYATPLTPAEGADPALVAQVTERNAKYAAQREELIAEYPKVVCE